MNDDVEIETRLRNKNSTATSISPQALVSFAEKLKKYPLHRVSARLSISPLKPAQHWHFLCALRAAGERRKHQVPANDDDLTHDAIRGPQARGHQPQDCG